MLLIFWEQIYNGFTSQAPGKSTWKPTWQGTGTSGTALLHPYLCPEHGIAGTKMSATHHIACAVAAQTRARTLQLLKIAYVRCNYAHCCTRVLGRLGHPRELDKSRTWPVTMHPMYV